MNTVRKLIGVTFLAAFALVSGAAMAAEKQYKLSVVDPNPPYPTVSLPTSSPATIAFKFENLGNSSYNSLSITIPTGYVVPLAGITTTRGTPSIVGNQVHINNINLPTGTGQFVVVALTGVTAGSCSSGAAGTWITQPWTGSTVGSGQTFAIKQSSYPTTNIGPKCLTIDVPPITYVNTQFQVSVGYSGMPGNIALSSTCAGFTPQSKPASSSPVSFDVTLGTPGTCAFTASAAGYTSATASTTVYTGNACSGGLGEFGSLPVNTDPPLAYYGPPDWGLQSSVTKKNGSACTEPVPFTFDFNPNTTPQTASFNVVVPPGGDTSVKTQYVLLWAPVAVDTSVSNPEAGWTTRNPRPYVGWLKDVGDPSKYKLVPALWCKDDGLGAAADVLPTIPAVEPFVTLAATYPDYAPGKQAQMCVAQTGSTAVGGGFVQTWHKITDYVDGAVSWGAD